MLTEIDADFKIIWCVRHVNRDSNRLQDYWVYSI